MRHGIRNFEHSVNFIFQKLSFAHFMMTATHWLLETGTNLLSQAVALHTSAQLCCNSHKYGRDDHFTQPDLIRDFRWNEIATARTSSFSLLCIAGCFQPCGPSRKTTTDEEEMRLRCRYCWTVSRRLHRSHNDLMKSPPEEPCLGRGKTRTHLCSCNLTNRCLENSIYISLISRGGLSLPNSLAVCQRLTVTYC